MSNDERLWWSILADADLLSEIANHQGDGPLAVRYMIVANRARLTLRDKFGVNLDDYGQKARDQVNAMADEEKAKDEAERKRVEEALAALDRAEKLLGIK